ncbi:MAG TPA: sigma-70 family RNA polymerase sigma factor, partial [Acidimicrobiales bacterium]|nr:sigma-70 family RNA polymerase sigma factor [Acidimicrobiales bacterium]
MTWVPADDALLAGYGTGDPQAAASFIRRHQARVYGLALSIVLDPALAEDVAQEAFTRAWRHAATYDPRRGTVPTWLLTITRNMAIDTLRLRRSVPVDPATLAALEMKATGAGAEPARSAELADQATRLRAALADLPRPQRRALVLAGL